MSQLNIHVTSGFEKDLKMFMKLRHINTKSEAIRIAIREGIQHIAAETQTVNFEEWLGLGIKIPTNKKTKFVSDDDLWK